MLFAQGLKNPVLEPSIRNLKGVAFFNRALPFFIHWLILIGFFTFLIYFILGGLKFITSKGDKTKIEEAQQQLTNGFIGMIIVFSVFAVIKLLGSVLGISGLQDLQIVLPQL